MPNFNHILIRHWIRPAGKAAGILLTAVIGILICLYLFGSVSFKAHELTWKIYSVPSLQGQTIIEFPPFGNLSAKTHSGLLDLHIRLEQVGTQLMQTKLFEEGSQDQIVSDIQQRIPHVMLLFSIRLILAGFFGGSVLVYLVWRSRFKVVLATGLLGAVLMSASLLQGYLTFQTGAFQEPQYEGVISQAPVFIRFANESISKLGDIRDQANTLIDRVENLVSSTTTMSRMETLENQGEVKKILLVSDLHSNPVGIELIKSLVTSFGIDFIIDSGDLTDFGTPLETKTAEEISNLGVPYVFIPGNHETEDMVKFMEKLPNVTVLKGHTKNIQGINILGFPDPLSSSPDVQIDDPEVWGETVHSTVEKVSQTIKEEGRPDILVIHNPKISRKIMDNASLIVSGHTHLQSLETLKNGSVLLNPGTTGAAGIRGLYSKESIPYSAIILHYTPGKGPLAADFIQYDLLSKHFSLDRHLEDVNKALPPPRETDTQTEEIESEKSLE